MRKAYIDNIRSMTILLVVLYHVVYLFSAVTIGVIGPVTSWHGLDALMYLLYPWFMVILFILSGMSSHYYLEQHSAKEFVRARTRKLLVPSTLGILVFGWAQGYLNMAIAGAFETMPDGMPPGIISYLVLCVSGTGVLWTMQVMWICALVLLFVRRLEKGRLVQFCEKTGIIALLLMGILLWGAAQILNTPVVCVYRFGIYGFAYLAGYYVFAHEKVIGLLERYCVPLLAATACVGIVYVRTAYGNPYAEVPYVNAPLPIAYCWLMCLAVLGCMKRWGDRNSRIGQFWKSKSFGLYVFHYLPLSACGYCLTRYTTVPGWMIYVLTAVSALLGGLMLYEIFSRIPLIRWCLLGISGQKQK